MCDIATRSYIPITNFSQFQCRGIQLTATPGGAVVGSFYWFSAEPSWVEVAVPGLGVTPGGYFDNDVTLVSFTEPSTDSNGKLIPGTFKFNWQELNVYDGKYHTGTASGTWENQVICGGRGCQWNAPKLLGFSTTVQ
jgi:hypothetical protein